MAESGLNLVTGASGTVGKAVAAALLKRGLPRRLALRGDRTPEGLEGSGHVSFDFNDAATFQPALAGVSGLFLLRPPAMARPAAFQPFLEAARAAGVGHVVFLSVRGAERNPLLPHHGIEKLVAASGIPWTHLRPNDFMQNFATVHAADIRRRSEIRAPGGEGRASWVDVRDVGEAAAAILAAPAQHAGRGYTLTGPEALTLEDAAAILSAVLGRRIANRNPGLAAFLWGRWRRGEALPLSLVMGTVYTVQRLGLAAQISPDLPRLIGRGATRFESFARDNADIWR